MGRWKDSIDKNTEMTEKQYREQYFANHGEYPPEPKGCLAGLIGLLLLPFKWIFKGFAFCFKWTFKGIYLGFKGLFYTFPRFLLRKGKIGKILLLG